MSAAPPQSQLDTIPKLLLHNAKVHGRRPAYREKALGIWQSWNWGDVLQEVRSLALGLERLGAKQGDAIAIIGDNRPRLYWTFTAAQTLGAVPVPIYQDSVADEMAYVLDHAEVRIAVVEDQEQADKVLSVAERLPRLERIIYDDPRGLEDYGDARLISFAEVQKLGRSALSQEPEVADAWLKRIAEGKGSDVSVILYTSGTTGRPKGVMLTHENVVVSGRNANAFDHFTPDDSMIAYLPMAWVGDHIFSYGQAFAGALTVCCPESPETATDDRREIGPTYFFAPPRVFETMLTQIMVRMEDAGPIKKGMFDYFLRLARRCGERVLDGKPVGPIDRLLYGLGNVLVYGPLRNRMGFSNLRVAYTAGEAIGPELFSFFRALGINLKQLYGQTEASVFITLQPDGEVYPETVGKPGPGVQLRVEEGSGEVLFKSPGVFLKYFKNDEATAATKTAEGWVRTGDAGFVDERGHLRIIDRAKDVGRLTSGALFSPKYIENRLRFFPEIKETVVFGHGRPYATAFINIDLVSVGNWAERNDVIYGSYQELAGHPQVRDLIARRIDELNQALAREPLVAESQIRRFLILHKELDADDGELTRTLKVRRAFIAERYAPFIAALYDGSKQAHLSVEVTYEDGRKGRIEGNVEIVDARIYPAAQTTAKEAAE